MRRYLYPFIFTFIVSTSAMVHPVFSDDTPTSLAPSKPASSMPAPGDSAPSLTPPHETPPSPAPSAPSGSPAQSHPPVSQPSSPAPQTPESSPSTPPAAPAPADPAAPHEPAAPNPNSPSPSQPPPSVPSSPSQTTPPPEMAPETPQDQQDAQSPSPSPSPSNAPPASPQVPSTSPNASSAPVVVPKYKVDIYMAVLPLERAISLAHQAMEQNAQKEKNIVPGVPFSSNEDDLRTLFAINLRQGAYNRRLRCFQSWYFDAQDAQQAKAAYQRLQRGAKPETVFSDPSMKPIKSLSRAFERSKDTQTLFRMKRDSWALEKDARTGLWRITRPLHNVDCLLETSEAFFQKEKPYLEREMTNLVATFVVSMMKGIMNEAFTQNPDRFIKIVTKSIDDQSHEDNSPMMFYHFENFNALLSSKPTPNGPRRIFMRAIAKDMLTHIQEHPNESQVYVYADPLYGVCWYQVKKAKTISSPRGPGPAMPPHAHSHQQGETPPPPAQPQTAVPPAHSTQ